MKKLLVIVAALVSTCLSAQENRMRNYVFSDAPPPNAYLLRSGDKTILIYQSDIRNTSHNWTSFDSMMEVTGRKKLITPNASEIIKQHYLENGSTITRIDQWIKQGRLHISYHVFDENGNITEQAELTDSLGFPAFTNKKELLSFNITQSADKRTIVLSQYLAATENTLHATILLLGPGPLLQYSFPIAHEPELQDIYPPLVADDQSLFVFVADKFANYRLGTILTSYALHAADTAPVIRHFNLPRKKIKDIVFGFANEKLVFTSFFSESDLKTQVTGILHAECDYRNRKQWVSREYRYSQEIRKELKKIYNQPGPADRILNNMVLLPDGIAPGFHYKYAILAPLPTGKNDSSFNNGSTARVPYINTREVQERLAYVNSLVGRVPRGSGQPIRNYSEAASYAAINPTQRNPLTSASRNYSTRPDDPAWHAPRNLLFFSIDTGKLINVHRFYRIRPTSDIGYEFMAYVPGQTDYSCLYYFSKGLTQPYLSKLSIDHAGNIREKKVFDHNDKIVLPGYPFLIRDGRLIAFYQYKVNQDLGIISIQL